MSNGAAENGVDRQVSTLQLFNSFFNQFLVEVQFQLTSHRPPIKTIIRGEAAATAVDVEEDEEDHLMFLLIRGLANL